MRIFQLLRSEDVTGVSGTGVVADGIEFEDGRCAYRWRGTLATTVIADNIADVEQIHGHDGKTEIVWLREIPS